MRILPERVAALIFVVHITIDCGFTFLHKFFFDIPLGTQVFVPGNERCRACFLRARYLWQEANTRAAFSKCAYRGQHHGQDHQRNRAWFYAFHLQLSRACSGLVS